MGDISRRRILQVSAALGLTGALSQSTERAVAQSSPALEKYAQPLPVPPVREPDDTHQGADFYEIPVTEFTAKLHPELPDTTLWGFDGRFPGPIIEARRNERIKVRFDVSDLPTEHLLPVDERINGTTAEDYPEYDGPVPEVRTVTHFHGLDIEPESDGQAEMWKSPEGVTGPRFAKHVHEIPNRQRRLTSTYHDHALGISRLNIYAGLVGFYFIRSQLEDQLDLPTGEYDVPLMLQDRTFNEAGSLHYPDSFVPNFSADTAVVNGAVWPYLDVEPRRYRLRPINPSNGRTYNLQLENAAGTGVPTMYQFAAGHGFLESVVSIGPDGDLDSLLLAPFERGDVVVDFSGFAGETFILTNDAGFPFEGETEGSDLGELLQIRVSDPSEAPADPSADPLTMDLPDLPRLEEADAVTTRHSTLNMIRDEHDLATHLLNERRFHDETVIKPQLGTTEIWELENKTHHTHPIHLHLVNFQIIGRGPDGDDDPDPNETVGKDIVRVNPDETARILVQFGDFAGQFPFHCHVLEHEDHEMMRPFEVVTGDSNDDQAFELELLDSQPFPGARDVRTRHDQQGFDNFAFIAGGESGLAHVVDVRDPEDLQVVANLDPPGGETDDVKAEGDLMQVNNDGGIETEQAPGIHYYDISDPRNPQPQGTFKDLAVFPEGVHDTHLHQGITYASDPTGGGSLAIIDPSDPTDPEFVGEWRVEEDAPREFQDDADPGDYPHSQYGIGDHLYLAYQGAGCRVLDVSDPTDPVEIARFGMDADLNTHDVRVDEREEVCVLGGEVYCGEDLDADVNEGYHLWDISDLDNPQRVSTIEPVEGLECKWDGEPNATSHNVDIANNRLYTAEYEGGVRVFDIRDPADPVQLAHFNVENDDELTQNPPGAEPNEFEMWDTARWNRGTVLATQRSPLDRLASFRLSRTSGTTSETSSNSTSSNSTSS